MALYGREDDEWDQMTEAGLDFLIERAKLQRTTSYTELNTALTRRTGLRPFDFDRADERAAMGELLGRIVMRTFAATRLMVSALVIYLNENDAGSGFYALASQLDLLPTKAGKQAKEMFWIDQVKAVHAHYSDQRTSRPTR